MPPAPWMTAPATLAVMDALAAGGAAPRFVGGCVRDAWLGRPAGDIDIATPEPPETVMARLADAGLTAIPTGLDHGTVTAVADHQPFEITTLREDVETDGRHARVAFTDDWRADAGRRDLTINALSCRPDGTLFDYFDGLADLAAGRVRFIGDPLRRLDEDILRLLRFYRFHAHYGRGMIDPAGHDACAARVDALTRLSGERIRTEMTKLLAAPDPVPVLTALNNIGALGVLGLPAPELAHLAGGPVAPRDPMLRLAALIGPRPDIAAGLARRWRLSRAERDRLADLAAAPPLDPDAQSRARRRALYHLGPDRLGDRIALAEARLGRPLAAWRATLDSPRPVFPLAGRDVRALGVAPGPEIGRLLRRVEAWWLAQDMPDDPEACRAMLKQMAVDSHDGKIDHVP